MGAGSLGGKARGLAFIRHMLHKRRVARRFPEVRVGVPPAAVLATDAFDRFLAENNLLDFAVHAADDSEIQQRFLTRLSPRRSRRICGPFLRKRTTLGGTLLEFAGGFAVPAVHGVYETFMLGNQQTDDSLRLQHLTEA